METISYKCLNCGAELAWDPDKGMFSCEYCFSDFTEDELKAAPDQDDAEAAEEFNGETDIYVCASCGAEIFCDHNTAATFCYYCHNPVSLKGRLVGQFKPDKIMPFKIGHEKAVELFKEKCKKKLFLPADFVSDSTIEKMTGLYVPFWVADVDVDAQATGKAVESRSVRRGDTTHVTEVTYSLERAAKMRFTGIPADGSKRIDDDVMDAVEPFDYNDLRDFDMSYLSGFFCDKYDVDKLEVLPRIKERVDKAAVDVLKNDMSGHGAVTITDKRIRIINTTWKYIMLPVWFMTYKYRGKVYNYAINGQTAKPAGTYPVSVGKIIVMIALIVAMITLIGTLIGGA